MSCLFVDHLTVIDCAYLDAARGLVGESWIVDLELEGELDAQSMVLDFGEVKRRIKRAIDDGPDHTLIVPTEAPGLHLDLSTAECRLTFTCERGVIRHESPGLALTLLPVAAVSAEAVATHLQSVLRPVVPTSVQRVGLTLRPEVKHRLPTMPGRQPTGMGTRTARFRIPMMMGRRPRKTPLRQISL